MAERAGHAFIAAALEAGAPVYGDKTVDPFYWGSGELPLAPRSRELQEAA